MLKQSVMQTRFLQSLTWILQEAPVASASWKKKNLSFTCNCKNINILKFTLSINYNLETNYLVRKAMLIGVVAQF